MRRKLAASAIAGVLLLAVAAGPASAGERAVASACTPKGNLEAIIDDSGSMGSTDSERLRVRALELFIDTPGNESKTLGGVEFGTDAQAIFGPSPIGPNRGDIKSKLDTEIQADDGLTDYNDAFSLADRHNAGADGRIFLTDGGHNQGDYADGHSGGPPVYVIGLGFQTGGEDEQRLKRIASETGGLYLPTEDASELQAAMNDVNAAVNCQAKPVRYQDTFDDEGETKKHALGVGRRVRSVQFAISWASDEDRFDIGGFRVLRRGQLVARQVSLKRFRALRRQAKRRRALRRRAARRRAQRRRAQGRRAEASHRTRSRRHRRAHRRKRRRVRPMVATKRRGETFVTVKLRPLVRGRLRFRVKAHEVSSPGVGVELTTQASRSRRR